jgi:hypothetical protein
MCGSTLKMEKRLRWQGEILLMDANTGEVSGGWD